MALARSRGNPRRRLIELQLQSVHFISAVESQWIVGQALQLGSGQNIEEMVEGGQGQPSGWGTIFRLFAFESSILGA